MKTTVIVLTLVAVALGAGVGFVSGFTMSLIDKARTDLQLGCALLQTAESAGYITGEQRSKLVDEVVPPIPKDPEPRSKNERVEVLIESFVQGWWNAIREDLKSGCRGVASPAPESNA